MSRAVLAATFLSVVASLALIGTSLYQRKQTLDRTSHEICVAVSNINRVVTEQLERSKQNLPKLAYFRDHPDELRQQLRNIDHQLKAFKPRNCQ